MRKLLTCTTCLTLLATAQAQTVSLQNTYRQNDQLAGRQIPFPSFSGEGTGLVWDISELTDEDGQDYVVTYEGAGEEDEELMAVTEQDTRYLYRTQGDSLLVRGFENHVSLMDYDLPEAYLRFPMYYGDSIGGYFHGVGRYCDRLAVRHYGRYKTKADGAGSFVIADGDTLRNVLRLHTERIMAAEETDIALADSLPTYNTDSIDNHLAVDSVLIRLDVWRWYAEGYRYPVLEARQCRDGGSDEVLSAVAYYYPPSALATISNDPENEETRARTRGESPWGAQPVGENSHPTERTADEAGKSGDGTAAGCSVGSNLYGISGRRISERQKVRNGVYLREQHQGENRTAEKVTIKK